MMLNKCSILCFGKDWTESPTSNNHVMSLLAKENKVLWINSVGMRTPSLKSGRDIRKIFKKIKENLKGEKHIKDNLYVYSPLAIPVWKSKIFKTINKFLLIKQIKTILKKLKMEDVQLWLFYPTAGELIGCFNESFVLYYCTDDWSKFSYLDTKLMKSMEKKLLKRTDLVVATSKVLQEDKRSFNANVQLITHGVDFDLFASASNNTQIKPADIQGIPKPIIGFYGLIQDWIDFELIQRIATTHPDWSIVMIGKVATDISSINHLKNVYFLGEKQYELLPIYSTYFDVGIIPYDVKDERMQSVNPTKLKQYLASGLPVVSVNLPEVIEYKEVVSVANSHEEFVKEIEDSISEATHSLAVKRREAVKNERWIEKVNKLSFYIEQTQRRI